MAQTLIKVECPRCRGAGLGRAVALGQSGKVYVDTADLNGTRTCPNCDYVWDYRSGMPVADLNPPGNYTDGIIYLTGLLEGTAVQDSNEHVTLPTGNLGSTISSAKKGFGALPAGITYDPVNALLVGTPGAGSGGVAYYFEVTYTWDDGCAAIYRYTLPVASPP